METARDIRSYEEARASWLQAIDQKLGHAIISGRWEAVRMAAQRIDVTPGSEVSYG